MIISPGVGGPGIFLLIGSGGVDGSFRTTNGSGVT